MIKPLTPGGFPIDELNCLAFDRVKYSGVRVKVLSMAGSGQLGSQSVNRTDSRE